VERLIWINENFFRIGDTSHHELTLYFSVAIPDDTHPDLGATFHCDDPDGTRFEVVWHRRNALKEVRLVPSFLTYALTNIPASVQHVVHIDAGLSSQGQDTQSRVESHGYASTLLATLIAVAVDHIEDGIALVSNCAAETSPREWSFDHAVHREGLKPATSSHTGSVTPRS
jgi:hypothetical protein